MSARATLSILSIALSAVVFSAPLSTPAPAAASSPPNLSGTWKLDRARSDTPRGGMGRSHGPEASQGKDRPEGKLEDEGRGGRRGADGRGPRGEMGPGNGGPPEGRRGRGPGRLPESVIVVQTVDGVELQDSTGVVLRRITTADSTGDSTGNSTGNSTGASQPDLSANPKDPSVIETSRGTWEDQSLVVRSPGPDGHQATQTFSLADDGQTLKVTTHVEASGDRPAVEFTRIYHKTSSR
jgi:hypothetical protein